MALLLWALGLADKPPLTSRATGFDAAQTEPTTGKAVAGPARRPPERFMVTYQGFALLGPGGQEEERWSRSLTGREPSPRTAAGRSSASPSRTRRRAGGMAGS